MHKHILNFLLDGENGAVNMDNMQSEKENENGVDKSTYVNGATDSKGNLFSHKFLFGVIFSRCRDLSATVRAKVCVYDVYIHNEYLLYLDLTHQLQRT